MISEVSGSRPRSTRSRLSTTSALVVAPISLSFDADPKQQLLLSYSLMQEILRDVARRPNVASLSLQGNFIPRRCVPLLANFIACNKAIRSVDLSQCGLGDDSAEMLLKATSSKGMSTMHSHLTTINLSHNYLTDRTCSYLRSISSSTSLRDVNLSFNPITNKGLTAALAVGSLLTALHFRYCLLNPLDSLVGLLSLRLKDSTLALRTLKIDGNGFKRPQYDKLKKVLEGKTLQAGLAMGRAAGPLSALRQQLEDFLKAQKEKEKESNEEEKKENGGEKDDDAAEESEDDRPQTCPDVDPAVVDEIASVVGKIVAIRKQENEEHLTIYDATYRTRSASKARTLLQVEDRSNRKVRTYEDGDAEFYSRSSSAAPQRRSTSVCADAPNFRRERAVAAEEAEEKERRQKAKKQREAAATESQEKDGAVGEENTSTAAEPESESQSQGAGDGEPSQPSQAGDDGQKDSGNHDEADNQNEPDESKPAEQQNNESPPQDESESKETEGANEASPGDESNGKAEAKEEKDETANEEDAEEKPKEQQQEEEPEEEEEEPFVPETQPKVVQAKRSQSRGRSQERSQSTSSATNGRSASVRSVGSARSASRSSYVDPVADPHGFGQSQQPTVKSQLGRGKLARLLLDRAIASDAQATLILNVEDLFLLEAGSGAEYDLPDALVDFSGVPSSLQALPSHSERRVMGLAKLLFMILYAPGDRIPVEKIVHMNDLPTTIQSAPVTEQTRYRSGRNVENNTARKVLQSMMAGAWDDETPSRSRSRTSTREGSYASSSNQRSLSSASSGWAVGARSASSSSRPVTDLKRVKPRYLQHYKEEKESRKLRPAAHPYRAPSSSNGNNSGSRQANGTSASHQRTGGRMVG